MICPKCGAEIINGSSFCIKCGTDLRNNSVTEQTVAQNVGVNQPQVNNTYTQQPQVNNVYVQQPVNNQKSGNSFITMIIGYFMYFFQVLISPVKAIEKNEENLSDTKHSLIMSAVITVTMTIIKLISTMLSAVRVKSFSLKGTITTKWQWENLKNVKYIEVIGKNFLIYAGIIFAIACVYYIGSLIVKKEIKFIKSVSIATSSIIPAALAILLLSPICSMIWIHLGIVVAIVGAIYSIVVLYELMNRELKLEGDMKIYFNLVCLGILVVAGFYISTRLTITALNNSLGNVLDFLK